MKTIVLVMPQGKRIMEDAPPKQMIGPSPQGPKRCLCCHQPFRDGEAWTRYTSPAHPRYGAYSIGMHAVCAAKRK